MCNAWRFFQKHNYHWWALSQQELMGAQEPGQKYVNAYSSEMEGFVSIAVTMLLQSITWYR
jgi:hypothetical protein